MREENMTRLFAGICGTEPYTADAEIVRTEYGFELFSTDGFSETEDFLTNTPPETVGHNIAVAACSDLLACGVRPEFLLQALNIDDAKPQEYYRHVVSGIDKVLRRHGARCIGGDLGAAQPWNCTLTVTARSATPPVIRLARSREPFELYISGSMGTANLAAFRREPLPRFAVRDPVPPEALFATDASGGFFDALENFRRVNRGMRLQIDAGQVIAPEVTASLPPGFDPLWALVGGVGDYELVFAAPRGVKADGVRIGEGEFASGEEDVFEWSLDGRSGRMGSAPPDYRNIAPEEWLDATREYVREMGR